MRVHRHPNAPSNEFGRMLTRVLIGRGLDNDGLRKRLRDAGQRPSAEFVQRLCAGQRDPSPRLIEAVVKVFGLAGRPRASFIQLRRSDTHDRWPRHGKVTGNMLKSVS
jgi:hypothetical protein